jgi:hypothetical protein
VSAAQRRKKRTINCIVCSMQVDQCCKEAVRRKRLVIKYIVGGTG